MFKPFNWLSFSARISLDNQLFNCLVPSEFLDGVSGGVLVSVELLGLRSVTGSGGGIGMSTSTSFSGGRTSAKRFLT